MAGIKFSRKEFEKHIKITEEIKEKINLFGTHLENVTEDEIELEILPNRPDLFSLQTFIKSFSAFLGKNTGLREYKLNKPEKNYEVIIDKSVKDVRPFTACAIVKGMKFDDEKIKEIINIQEKIHTTLGRNRKKIAIGIYPLEKITLPIKFEARHPKDIKFIPLEMDRELNGLQILQQHPTGRDYAHLLEGCEKFPVFADAKGKILSMPPIINSHETGKISKDTTDIFIECSGFDFNILKKTLNILIVMLAEMNGKVYQMKLGKEITPDLTPEIIKLDIENVNKTLGLSLKEDEIKKLLEKMGYDYSKGKVSIPAWRTDIMHEADIIEDVAIAYGYEKFTPEIPPVATIGEVNRKESIKKKISDILTGLEMLELSSYHLVTKEDLSRFELNPEKVIELEKSKTDFKYLKPSMLLSTLNILSENIDNEYPQKIFEIGKEFKKDTAEETSIKEKDILCISLNPGNFTEIKQILEYLARMLNIQLKVEETSNKSYIEGRVGKIMLKEKEIGFIGEIHPQLLKNFHLKMPSSCLELDLEEVYSLMQ